MKKNISTKRALLFNLLSMLLCVSMLVGSTFAWFTDTASTAVNTIQAGNLDIQLLDADGNELGTEPLKWVAKDGRAQSEILWEPGATYSLESFRIKNNGNLSLKYKVVISGIQGNAKLLEVLDFTYTTTDNAGATTAYDVTAEHVLAAGEDSGLITITGHMQETAGNEYENEIIDGIAITVYAAQATLESDGNGNTYDRNATYYPVIDLKGLNNALEIGGEVAVDADVTVYGTDTNMWRTMITKPTTLNLNKKIVSPDNMGENNYNFAALFVLADTTINAGADGGIDTGVNGAYAINVKDGANLTITGGTYYGGGTAVQVQKGHLVITGGMFACEPYSGMDDGYKYLLNCIDSAYANGTATITVKGGTFVNFDPSNNKAEGNGTNFVADGYSVIKETKENGDVWYTVVEGTVVTSVTEFETALANGGKVVLNSNIDLGDSILTVPTGKDVTIDLNGKTVTAAKTFAVVENGAKLTISNGKVTSGRYVFNTQGGEVVVNGGDYTAQECVFALFGGSTLTVNDGTFTAKDNSVISTNGSSAEGCTITVNGGTFNANIQSAGYIACGVYVANKDTVNINAGTFNVTDGVGILMRAGNTTIGADVVINLISTGSVTAGRIGDATINITTPNHLVADVRSQYPGLDSSFTVTNNTGYTLVEYR